MRRRLVIVGLAGWLSLGAPSAASAQEGRGAPALAGRQRMERQLREGVWRVARERIPLDDEQMRRLQAVSTRLDARRQALGAEERSVRQALRTEIAAGEGASDERVAAALDRLLLLQRRRLDIVGEEQKELAAFMTPVQRAKYSALQDQLRRRVDNVRRRRQLGAQRDPS